MMESLVEDAALTAGVRFQDRGVVPHRPPLVRMRCMPYPVLEVAQPLHSRPLFVPLQYTMGWGASMGVRISGMVPPPPPIPLLQEAQGYVVVPPPRRVSLGKVALLADVSLCVSSSSSSSSLSPSTFAGWTGPVVHPDSATSH